MTTMPGYRPYPPSSLRRPGLGITALTLGVLALPLSFLCGLGILPGLAGLALGTVAAVRDRGRTQAILGILASALALAIAAGVIAWFLGKAAKCGDTRRYPDRAARARCVQREFPLVRRGAPDRP